MPEKYKKAVTSVSAKVLQHDHPDDQYDGYDSNEFEAESVYWPDSHAMMEEEAFWPSHYINTVTAAFEGLELAQVASTYQADQSTVPLPRPFTQPLSEGPSVPLTEETKLRQ